MTRTLEVRVISFLTRRLMADPRFFHESGYKCPYCGYRGRQNTPLSAYHVAVHVYKDHSEEVRREIILEMELT